MKYIGQRIYELDKQAKLMMEFGDIANPIYYYMIYALENRISFGHDMLYYAWYFETHHKEIKDPLKSGLLL